MKSDDRYSISTDVRFGPLELIDIPNLINECEKKWQNFTLCEVNDCVVRLGVIHGEFHWHRHDLEDEFFYVITGLLYIDLDNRTVELGPKQGLTVPRRVNHRTRAPERTAILMFEGSTVIPTGSQ